MVESRSSVRVQVLQKAEYGRVEVFTCKVSIQRVVDHCGMSSHSSLVSGGFGTFVREVGRDACRDIHRYGTIAISPTLIIRNIRPNSTSHYSVTLAGKVDATGACTGSFYNDELGSWDDVRVLADVSISIRTYLASIKYTDDEIILDRGLKCRWNSEVCVDAENGETYWTTPQQQRCEDTQVVVRYEGLATEIKEIDQPSKGVNQTSYLIQSSDKVLWLTRRGEESLCGYTVVTTEHPRLLLYLSTQIASPFVRRESDSHDLDMFMYINTKFVYYDKNIQKRMSEMYYDLAYQRCQLESQVLQGLMSSALKDPVQFARDYMQSPGYTAMRRNEVIHIIRCLPVDLPIYYSDRCYDEMPLNQSGTLVFRAPRTHIIQPLGTEIGCNSILSGGHLIGTTWFSFNPGRVRVDTPEDMRVTSDGEWSYVSVDGLATRGLYSSEELAELQHDLMFPTSREAVQSNFVRAALGYDVNSQGANFGNLVDEIAAENVAKRVWNKAWGWLSGFGDALSGFLGLYGIYLIGKTTLTLLFNSLSLYEAFGWSFRLFAAIKSSLTAYLLNKKRHQSSPQESPEEGTVLTPIAESAEPSSEESKIFTEAREQLRTMYPTLK